MMRGLRVLGYVGSTSLNWTWVMSIDATSASMATLKGTRSVFIISSRSPSITGSSTWGSTGVFALPG